MGAAGARAQAGSAATGEQQGGRSSTARMDFGSAWIACALEDVVGSVVVHTTRKSAAAVSSRPTTAGGSRPMTSGSSPPTTARKPSTPGTARAGAQKQESKPISKQTRSAMAAIAAEARLRLLALKHFVAAVRSDPGLRACPLLESCLAEVATGVVPHVESSELLAVDAYRIRLREWTEQEARAGGSEAAEQAMAQALKTTVATVSVPAAPAPRGRASQAAVALPEQQPSSDAKARRGQWLPKAFVREFNAEGEEVEQDVDDPELEALAPASGADAAAASAGSSVPSSARLPSGARQVSFTEPSKQAIP